MKHFIVVFVFNLIASAIGCYMGYKKGYENGCIDTNEIWCERLDTYEDNDDDKEY